MYKHFIYTISLVIAIIVLIQFIKAYCAFSIKDKCQYESFNLTSNINKKKLLLLGDSTVCGTNLNRCTDSIAHKFHNQGYNVTKIGKAGFRIQDLFKELHKHKHVLKDNYDMTVIFIGTNDILQHSTINKEKITKDLTALLHLITQHNKGNLGKIIIPSKGNNTNMGLLIFPFTKVLQARIDIYDTIAEKMCSKFDIHFVKLSDKLYKCGNTCRAEDNMHLNGKGFDIVVEDVLKAADKIK